MPNQATSGASVSRRLLARYYREGAAVAEGASSHWRDFSQYFAVTQDSEGDVASLSGHGFGESHRSSASANAGSFVAIGLHLLRLHSPDLTLDMLRARRIVHRMGLRFSFDAFRQACTAWRVASEWVAREGGRPPERLLVIGDGHGILSGLLHKRFPDAHITLIDLGPTLLFQSVHLGRAFPEATHVLTDDDEAVARANFGYCPADRVDSLPDLPIDIAFNVASMQEMSPDVVADYFSLLRRHKTGLFYCCNRLEKRLPDGEVLRIMEYPWSSRDVHIIDEPCPWHQWLVGRAQTPRLRVAGVPVPFFHRYDGVHWHRLTRLSHDV